VHTAVGRPDHKGSVGVCADWRIPRTDGPCGYQQRQADATKGQGEAYSPKCVEGVFSEVGLPFYGVLRVDHRCFASRMCSDHLSDGCPTLSQHLVSSPHHG